MAQFFPDFLGQLLSNMADGTWWAGEILSWIMFGVIAAAIAGWIDRRREHRERQPYEGWTLKVVGYGDEPQALYFEDVRRLKTSDFELLKFYKGIASGACQHNVRSINQVRGVWGFIDDAAKSITVDLTKIPAGQVKSWNDGNGPARNEQAPAR